MNKTIAQKSVAMAVCVTLLSGCVTDSPLSKQDLGTGIGALTGAVAGQFIGGGKGRILAAIAGAVIGGYLGNRIGASLDEADRTAVERETLKALAYAKDGKEETWNSSSSGAKAVIQPTNTRIETKKVAMLRDKRVEKPQQLDMIGKIYKAKSRTNLYAKPSKKSDAVGELKTGETFTAAGRVTGTEWIAVSKGARNIGYVNVSLVREVLESAQIVSSEQNGLRPAADLDQLSKNMAKGGVDLDTEGMVADEVVARLECRTININITSKNGQQEQETMNACRAADGAWEVL